MTHSGIVSQCFLEERQAVHARHLEIRQNYPASPQPNLLQRFLRIGCSHCGETVSFEPAHRQFDVVRLVIEYADR